MAAIRKKEAEAAEAKQAELIAKSKAMELSNAEESDDEVKYKSVADKLRAEEEERSRKADAWHNIRWYNFRPSDAKLNKIDGQNPAVRKAEIDILENQPPGWLDALARYERATMTKEELEALARKYGKDPTKVGKASVEVRNNAMKRGLPSLTANRNTLNNSKPTTAGRKLKKRSRKTRRH